MSDQPMTRIEFMESVADDVRTLMPSMKEDVDPLWKIDALATQMFQSGPVGMQPHMMVTMLIQEAHLPAGMSLTRKTPGGSVTATVKRRYGLRKGLSKKKTANQFSRMVHIANTLMHNRVDVTELHEHLPEFYSWCAVCDDGCEDFKGRCTGGV